jgi:HlyD family secretion protein
MSARPKGASILNLKLLGGIVLIVALVGVALSASLPSGNAKARTQPTVLVQRGNVTARVTGNGAIAAQGAVDLSFQTSGVVRRVLVTEGDAVQANEALAELDDRWLQAEVIAAQARLASARAKLSKTRQGATAQERAAAEAALASARAAHDYAIKDAATADLDLESARLTMDKAKVSVANAQAAYDRIGGTSNPGIGMTPQSMDLQNATLEYQNAVTRYQTQLKTGAANKSSKVESARSNVEKARSDLANLEVKAEDVAMDQASVDVAEQSLRQAQISLENATLKAPFEGVVTSVNVVTGSRTSSAPAAVRVMNANALHVDLKLSENDMVRVQLGQTVNLAADALQDWQADAKVSYIAPAAENTNGVVTYVARVSFTANEPLVRVGMTANVDIATARKNDVLIVPNTALLPKGNGHVLQVVGIDGNTGEVDVETGLTDGEFTEIIAGVSEGARVVALPSSGAPQAALGLPMPF